MRVGEEVCNAETRLCRKSFLTLAIGNYTPRKHLVDEH